MLIIETYLIVTENAKYDLAFVAYSVVLIVFYVWYLIHSVRGDEWVKGNWKAGQREFQIRLPDEEKPKKK